MIAFMTAQTSQQDRAPLGSAECDRAVVDARLHGSKEAQPHVTARVVVLVRDQPNHLLKGRSTVARPNCAACRTPVSVRLQRRFTTPVDLTQNRRRPGERTV